MNSKNRREGKVSLPFDWDFLQDNLPPETLAELRRRFMAEWRSGEYTKKEDLYKIVWVSLITLLTIYLNFRLYILHLQHIHNLPLFS